MARIAFIGMGIMGGPMARHLADAGHEVVGVANAQAVQKLVERGGRGAANVREAVTGADVVITMVPDSPDVESVALGSEGIYANVAPGTLHIDCSTIRPDTARALAVAGAASGVQVVDAPVSGGESGAIEGTLSIMVGGEPDAVARATPYLEIVGKTIVHVGPAGSGQTVKAANQLIVAGTIELVAEALVLVEAYGVDPRAAFTVLAGGLAGNAILDRKGAAMIDRHFAPGFRVDLHHKDMGIVLAAAREAAVAIPLGERVAQLMASLRAQGHGGLDHSALLLQVEEASGTR
ncbi:2-hydroxy-3-oxopropionate reductase [Streptomyces sp. DvalAA-14]|uniref:NAD(P)-dependent oxidoreductase n=1 Tax=unclassified Streptomyces TaxID=2593676 RepID=UPI00081B9D0E|nr:MULTISPECIES: NAD(P)-dependent oxidoreductase [unclassified Streptomyces]MYS21822.1 NAD-binding protein [Streptomyces sp. SID4948]SCE01842.1 2-hydroxy-3-oxopropionate reductase [Streptomyces sp. DvalAA-14]